MKAKYVIVEDMGLELAIVFSPIVNHSDLKQLGYKIVSAGFCTINSTQLRLHIGENSLDDSPTVQCFGESSTLGMKSRGELDAQLIAINFRG